MLLKKNKIKNKAFFKEKKFKILENVFLHVPSGTLYKPKLGLISFSKIGPGRIRRTGLVGTKKPTLSKTRKIKKGSSIYCNSANGGFYHWLIECIPRLENLPPDVAIYSPRLSSLNNQILNFFLKNSFQSHQVEDNWIFFNEFYLPKYNALPGSGFIGSSFRRKVLSKVICNTTKRESRQILFISRNEAPKRKFLNEKKFINNILKKINCKVVLLEKYTFQEQLNIIHSSKLIIAPHGAGLSNLIAANQDCCVLEIITSLDRPMRFYSDLCKSISIDYQKMIIEHPVGRHDDFKLSTNDFKYIESFIEKNI